MASPSEQVRIGRYRLTRRLGQGGMGVVYAAWDERLARTVALKLLPKSVARDHVAVRRFLHEARAAARLQHPNIVSVFDVDQHDGYTFLVMEYMAGGSVHDLLKTGPLDWRRAMRLVTDAGRGLAAAHDLGLIHRDIKPSNLMLTAEGLLKVADFGLVKDLASLTNALTQPGSVIGTPHFMSPEQCQGEPLDPRSDLYALGMTWFTLLTGSVPFANLDAMQIMFAQVSKPLPSLRALKPDLPDDVIAIVEKLVAKNRADRFASAAELVATLEELQSAWPTQSFSPPLGTESGGPPSAPPPTADRAPQSELQVFTGTAGPAANSAPAASTRLAQLPEYRPPVPPAPPPTRSRRRAVVWVSTAILCLAVAVGIGIWGFPGGSSARRSAAAPASGTDSPATDRPRASAPATERLPTLHRDWSIPDVPTFVRGMAFDPDGVMLYAALANGSVGEWDCQRRQTARTFRPSPSADNAPADPLRGVAVSPDGRFLAAGGQAGKITVWDRQTGSVISTGDCGSCVNALTFRPQGDQLAAGCMGSCLVFPHERGTLAPPKALAVSSGRPVGGYMTLGVAYSISGRRLAHVTWDERAAALWDAESLKLLDQTSGLPSQPQGICFSDRDDELFLALSEAPRPGGLYRWSSQTESVAPVYGTDQTLMALTVVPRASIALCAGGWAQPVCIVDVNARSVLRVPDPETSAARAVAFSPATRRFATGGGSDSDQTGFVHIWTLADSPRAHPP